jgi:hypothetical protein
MKLVPTRLTQIVGRQSLIIEKNAPSLMFVGGLACVVGGTVLACRATLKLGSSLDKFKGEIDKVKEEAAGSEEKPGRQMTIVYTTNTVDILKLYAPAIAATGAGVILLTKSHNTLMQRNASLTAAYAVLNEAYDAYRLRVREEVGEKREMELYRGFEKVKSISPGDDKPTEGYAVDMTKSSPYARMFDESCPNFTKNASANLMFIKGVEVYCNQKLQAQGHLFLNEVYAALGMPISSEGQIVGWLRDGKGDNFVDFFIEEAKNYMYLDGVEPRLFLDFNVDGIIYDQIGGYVPKFIKH